MDIHALVRNTGARSKSAGRGGANTNTNLYDIPARCYSFTTMTPSAAFSKLVRFENTPPDWIPQPSAPATKHSSANRVAPTPSTTPQHITQMDSEICYTSLEDRGVARNPQFRRTRVSHPICMYCGSVRRMCVQDYLVR